MKKVIVNKPRQKICNADSRYQHQWKQLSIKIGNLPYNYARMSFYCISCLKFIKN